MTTLIHTRGMRRIDHREDHMSTVPSCRILKPEEAGLGLREDFTRVVGRIITGAYEDQRYDAVRTYLRMLCMDAPPMLIVLERGRVRGFATWHPVDDPRRGHAHIDVLCVEPISQKLGYGAALLARLMEDMKTFFGGHGVRNSFRITITVSESGHSKGFFVHHGFADYGLEPLSHTPWQYTRTFGKDMPI